jgi:hypothetical protein
MIMKLYSLLLITFFSLNVIAQDIVINEIQATPTDWIELKNTTSSSINISGYFLSDDIDNIDKWIIPTGTALPANGYIVLYADGTNTGLHTNFKLSAGEETIILSFPDGSQIDIVEYPTMYIGASYGLLTDGSYSFMNNSTQGAVNDNSSAFSYISSDLTFSIPSGIYAIAQTVTLSKTTPGQIYYTTDGTTPNSSSLVYSSPITITNNTTLKAIVIQSATEYSTIENKSYIIGAIHDLPIVLLTSDNSSYGTGTTIKENIDGRVKFQFIEPDGTTVINQYADFKASGLTSNLMPQLNGKVQANGAYGDNDFDYKMFPNKNIDEFKSFLLRNASQDWSETHMRDAFISRLLSQDNLADFPFDGYRPAVLYVNAKYQGIINVREDDDSDYVKHNFNLNKDEFEKVGSGVYATYTFTTERDSLETRINFNNQVNLDFLIRYSQLNEWGFGVWKDLTGTTNHENHYFMHDFDASFGLYGFQHIPLTGPMPVYSMMQNNIANHLPYKNEAIQFIAAIINHIYNTDRAVNILDAMESELLSEIPAHAAVNSVLATEQVYSNYDTPPFANLTEWQNNVNALRTDITNRIDVEIFNRIETEYSLQNPVQITYTSSDISHGLVRVHNVKSINETFTGTYFSGIPIKFSAEALPGYRFVEWIGDVSDINNEISPIFNNSASITAVFEPIPFVSTSIVINEVQGKNDTTIADENGEHDDWIEIYNPGTFAVDLAGYYISDNATEPLKWLIPDTDAAKTTIPANGFLLLWADKDLSQGENHLDFKLKKTDEVLLTAPNATTLIQHIMFTDIEADISYGAETDASPTYISFSTPTPNASNNPVNVIDFDTNDKSINVYPNPTTNNITISISKEDISKPLTWKLYDLNGKIMLSGFTNTINLESLSKGIYILKVNDFNKKIIKR